MRPTARAILEGYGREAIADVLAEFGGGELVSKDARTERTRIAERLRRRAAIMTATEPEAAAFALDFAGELEQ